MARKQSTSPHEAADHRDFNPNNSTLHKER
jgi:hypothetical protein